MSPHLKIVVVSVIFACANAQIVGDFDCTTVGTQLVYSQTATVCSNSLSNAGCATLYNGGNASNVQAGNNAPRPSACFTTQPNGTTVDPSMKAAAIQNCPQFCGYCCDTPAYACSNPTPAQMNCNAVTPAMCQDPAWRQTLANSCPNMCGFCTMGGCVDVAVDCSAGM